MTRKIKEMIYKLKYKYCQSTNKYVIRVPRSDDESKKIYEKNVGTNGPIQ